MECLKQMLGKGRKKYYAVRVGRKPRLYNEWSEAEKKVMGYKEAEYSSFRLKRYAGKYLKSKKSQMTVMEIIQHDTENQSHDGNTHNNPQSEIPKVIDMAPIQGNESNYVVMDEDCYSEELEEKLMKNEGDLQNLWE